MGSAPLGKLSEIHLRHYGCWASELSLWLHSTRPDLELVVYARSVSNDPSSYAAVAVIKSLEKKEINNELHTAITQYLLSHQIIRSVKPRLPRPSNYTVVFLVRAFDDASPAAIRGVIDHGGTIHPRLGMPVRQGIERIRFLSLDPVFTTGQIQTAYSQHPEIYDVKDVELSGKMYTTENDLFEDPYFLPTYIICTPENRAGFIAAIRTGVESLVQWIHQNTPWLIPLLSEIIRWLYSREPTSMSPAPFYV